MARNSPNVFSLSVLEELKAIKDDLLFCALYIKVKVISFLNLPTLKKVLSKCTAGDLSYRKTQKTTTTTKMFSIQRETFKVIFTAILWSINTNL